MLGAVETVETPCGIRAIGRPCQSPKQRGQLTGHPIHPICIAPGEAVHILDESREGTVDLVEMVRRHGFDVRRHATASEMKNKILCEKAGCIVLDVDPLQKEGFHLFRNLKELGCTLPVIFLSGIESVKTAVECMRAGAANYICKPANELEFRDALVDAMAKARISYCRLSAHEIAIKKLKRLTPTELDVAKLLAAGHLTKKIAAMTNRSESTVKIHRARIMQKLEVTSPAMIVHLFDMI
jgi:FixJ family two-component response regulator